LVRLRADIRRLRRDEAGASAVEFALLAPVLCLLAAGVIDTGIYIVRTMEVNAAAQAGADFALANGWNAAGVAAAVQNATNSPLAITANPAPTLTNGCLQNGAVVQAAGQLCPDGEAAGQFVTVEARAPFTTLMPWPGLETHNQISARAQVRIS
jgi:Flp pilus assembly protein TadG